jgi:hypothetical protein
VSLAGRQSEPRGRACFRVPLCKSLMVIEKEINMEEVHPFFIVDYSLPT